MRQEHIADVSVLLFCLKSCWFGDVQCSCCHWLYKQEKEEWSFSTTHPHTHTHTHKYTHARTEVISAGIAWSSADIEWLGEAAGLICNFCLNVAAHSIFFGDLPLNTPACCLGVKQPSDNSPESSSAPSSNPYETN